MPTTSLMPLPKQQYLTALGTPLFGGKVYTYAAGTTTPKATYTDSAGTEKQPNPIPLNLRGEPENPIFWSGNYRVEVRDRLGNLIYTVDNYNTDPAGVWNSVMQTIAQFAAAAGSSLIGFLAAGAGAVATTVQAVLRERPSITQYGASASSPDNRVAIQKAFDSGAAEMYVPIGVYPVTLNPAAPDLAGVFGAGSVALHPRSNMRLYGPGTIRLKDGEVGVSGAVIGNYSGAAISRFVIDGVSIEGNLQSTQGQVSAVVLVDATECWYRNVTAKNHTYNGLQMRRSSGVSDGGNYGLKDCGATNCLVSNVGFIAYQFNRPDGLLVFGNKGDTCPDNVYDVEGNDPAGGQSNGGFGRGVRFFDNDADNCDGQGYFFESLGDVMFNNNRARECVGGAYFNRIASGSLDSMAIGNKFSRKLFPGGNGLTVSNNSGDMRIAENVFDGFENSLWFVNTAVSVTVGTNYHKNVGKYMVGYLNTPNAAVKCHVQKQIMRDAPGFAYGTPQLYPSLNPPCNCPSNFSTRAFRLILEDAFSLDIGAAVPANFKVGDAVLVYSTGWAAYSIFSVAGDGKTRVYFSSKPANATYALVNGQAYKLTATTDGSGAIYVAQWNGTAYVDGNFTTVLNAALPSELYPNEWTTE